MSERLHDVFNSEHRVSRDTLRQLDARDLQELELSVLGEANRPFRVKAMDALVTARGGAATAVLARVLANDGEDVTLRAAAASQLGRAGPVAERALVSTLREASEPTILVAVAGALAKVGSEAALEPLAALAGRDDAVGQQARFAQTVIAFRARRPGHEPPDVAEGDLLPVPDENRMRLSRRPLGTDEAPAAFEELRQDSYGVPLAREGAFRIDCAQERFLVALEREPVNGEQPTLAGVVARRSYAQGSYSVNWLVLTWPGADGALQVGVFRPSGHQVLAGTARAEGDGTTFELRSVQGRGNLPVEARGSVVGGQVTALDGASGAARPERGEPAPDTF
jgi:hypothetical protein